MELMEQLDQKMIFKKAFDYVKSRTNKDVVTIGDMLHYFVNKNFFKIPNTQRSRIR